MTTFARLESYYDEHAPALYRFLIRLTGNEEDTHDLLQEVFLRLARAPHQLDQVHSIRSYLFRMAHRCAIDHFRQHKTQSYYYDLIEKETPAFLEPETSPTDLDWMKSTLEHSLHELPAEQKAVVLLKIWEELTFAEIAQILEISTNTAASRYRYALDKLRDQLRHMERDLL